MKIKHSIDTQYLRFTQSHLLKSPAMQLSGPIFPTYLNNVVFAQLTHLFQPKSFLDLGCYYGALPMMVEDLLELAASDHSGKTQWYLVDNFSFFKETKKHNQNYNPNDPWLSEVARDFCDSVRNPKAPGILKNFPIPTDPTQLESVLRGVADRFKAPYPNIVQIAEDVRHLNDIKFDLVSFDLSANSFANNFAMLELLVNGFLNKNAVIAIDDIAAEHPSQLVLFLEAVQSLNLQLIGVAGKTTLMSNVDIKEKHDLIDSIHKARAYAANDGQNFFWILEDTKSEKYGSLLKMLPNLTHKNVRVV